MIKWGICKSQKIYMVYKLKRVCKILKTYCIVKRDFIAFIKRKKLKETQKNLTMFLYYFAVIQPFFILNYINLKYIIRLA